MFFKFTRDAPEEPKQVRAAGMLEVDGKPMDFVPEPILLCLQLHHLCSMFVLPEDHHVGWRLGEGGDEAGETQQGHEGQQEVGTFAAAGPGLGGTRTAVDAPTVGEVLQKHTDWVGSILRIFIILTSLSVTFDPPVM